MLNSIIYSTSLTEIQNPKEWPAWKIGLLVSVFVVLILGIVLYIFFSKKIKKIKKDYELTKENEIFLEASKNNENFGTIITDLEAKSKNKKANPLLTAFFVNTFAANNFKNIFIDDKTDDYFANTIKKSFKNASVSVQNYQSLTILDKNEDISKIDNITKPADMLVLLNGSNEPISYLKKYLKNLNTNGMCVFLYNRYNKKELKEILNYLQDAKIYRFEKQKIKSFNTILITNYVESKGVNNE